MEQKVIESEVRKNLRIDYSKYEIDEVVETISDAIFFPLYIGKVLVVVVIFFVVLFLFMAFFSTNYFILGFLFFILSYAVSLPSIIIISAIRLINTIRDDINKVIDITVETTKHIYNDSNLLKEQRESGIPLKSSFADAFRGVSLYVIRPSLKKVLERRIKFFSIPFTFLIDKIFRYVVIKKQPVFEVSINENDELEVAAPSKSLGSKIKSGSGKFNSITLGIVKLPLYVALIIYGTINFGLVMLFAWIF